MCYPTKMVTTSQLRQEIDNRKQKGCSPGTRRVQSFCRKLKSSEKKVADLAKKLSKMSKASNKRTHSQTGHKRKRVRV